MPTVPVTVLFFGPAREAVGGDRDALVQVPAPAGGVPTNLAHLRDALGARWPKLAVLLPRCMLVIGEDYSRSMGDASLGEGQGPISVIPPVSGG